MSSIALFLTGRDCLKIDFPIWLFAKERLQISLSFYDEHTSELRNIEILVIYENFWVIYQMDIYLVLKWAVRNFNLASTEKYNPIDKRFIYLLLFFKIKFWPKFWMKCISSIKK